MARSRAWNEFQAGRPQVAALLSIAESLPETIEVGQQIGRQEMVLRLTMVTVVGSLQAYLGALLEDWADKLVDDWNSLSVLQKRYVAVQAQRAFQKLITDISEGELWDTKEQNRFRTAAMKICEWLQKPILLAASPDREELTGFFRDLGSKAIDRALSRFRGDGIPFFGWLSSQNAAYRGYDDRLNEAIAIRNEVSHGVVSRRVTMRDVRQHWVLVTKIIRKAEEFVSTPGTAASPLTPPLTAPGTSASTPAVQPAPLVSAPAPGAASVSPPTGPAVGISTLAPPSVSTAQQQSLVLRLFRRLRRVFRFLTFRS